MSDIDLKICLSLYGRKNKPSLNFNPKIVRFKQFKLHFFTVILDRFRFHVFMTERQVPSSNINYLYNYICTSIWTMRSYMSNQVTLRYRCSNSISVFVIHSNFILHINAMTEVPTNFAV